MKKRRGISLIVLLITIIVILILTTTIILTFKNNNSVDKSYEAKFKSDLKALNEELMLTEVDLKSKDKNFSETSINVGIGEINKMKIYIPSFTDKYKNKLFIKNGNLLYVDYENSNYVESEEIWAREVGVSCPYGIIGDADGDGVITENDSEVIATRVASDSGNVSDRKIKVCDVNKDGSVNISDRTELDRYIQKYSSAYKGYAGEYIVE